MNFPNEDMNNSSDTYYEHFAEGGQRYGKITNGHKEGEWLSGDAGFDKNGNVYAKGGIWREEYFKNGLRDSIFREFETTFKKGQDFGRSFTAMENYILNIYQRRLFHRYFTIVR